MQKEGIEAGAPLAASLSMIFVGHAILEDLKVLRHGGVFVSLSVY